MQSSTPAPEGELASMADQAKDIVTEIRAYGGLITDSLYMIVAGMLVIFVVHKLASLFLYPRLRHGRLIKVVFGTFYVLIVVIAALIALRRNGFEVQLLAQVAFLVILIGAVAMFFLVPFLPRLPLMLGHLVEIHGELGFVDGLSTFHTTLRRLDGTMVFIPNPLVMASKILNFHDSPTRRVDLNLSVDTSCDLKASEAIFLEVMRGDDRVLDEPAPPSVFVVNVTAAGTDFMALCWVKNEDWFRTRSDLWMKLVQAFNADDRVAMSLPQQEVFLIGEDDPAQEDGSQESSRVL
jgi:small conductance mechanosensitive channel